MTDDDVYRQLFGKRNGQLPKTVREQVRFAADTINAHQRGMSIPAVALHVRSRPCRSDSET